MRKSLEGGSPDEVTTESLSEGSGQREIIVPYDPKAGPVTAVRNVLLQSSLGQLKSKGYFARYAQLIAPDLLEQIHASVGPGFVPIELAMAHYAACERLNLSSEELSELGKQVGDRVQDTVLVSPAKKHREPDFDIWSQSPALQRMSARLYQGGSTQIVKLGPKEKQVELRGFPMTRFHYYRQATLGALGATHAALGARITSLRIASYSPRRDELAIRLTWG